MGVPLGVKGYAAIYPSNTAGPLWGLMITGASISEAEGGGQVPVFMGKAGIHQPVLNANRMGFWQMSGYLPLKFGDDVEASASYLNPLNAGWVTSGHNLINYFTSSMNTIAKVLVSTDLSHEWTMLDVLLNQITITLQSGSPPMLAMSGYAGLPTSGLNAADDGIPVSQTTIYSGINALRQVPIINAGRMDMSTNPTGTTYQTARVSSAVITFTRPPAPLFTLGTNVHEDGLYNPTYVDNGFLEITEGGCGFRAARIDAIFEQRTLFNHLGALTDFYSASADDTLAGSSTSNFAFVADLLAPDGSAFSKIGWKFGKAIAFNRYDMKLAQPRNFYPITIVSAEPTNIFTATVPS